jgi:hypothetical protein
VSVLVGTVIELTDRVEAAIESGDWLSAQQLEGERRRLLEQLAISDAAGDLRATFATLESRNFRLIGVVEHLKRRVLREAAVERTARTGAAAYAELGVAGRGSSQDVA